MQFFSIVCVATDAGSTPKAAMFFFQSSGVKRLQKKGPSSTDIEFESESTETKFNLPCTAKAVRCFIEGQVKMIQQCHLFVGLSY